MTLRAKKSDPRYRRIPILHSTGTVQYHRVRRDRLDRYMVVPRGRRAVLYRRAEGEPTRRARKAPPQAAPILPGLVEIVVHVKMVSGPEVGSSHLDTEAYLRVVVREDKIRAVEQAVVEYVRERYSGQNLSVGVEEKRDAPIGARPGLQEAERRFRGVKHEYATRTFAAEMREVMEDLD